MPEVFLKLLADYGYIILWVTVFLMNAGVPLPGHTIYVAACLLTVRGAIGQNHMQGQLRGGGNTLRISTDSGSIRLH